MLEIKYIKRLDLEIYNNYKSNLYAFISKEEQKEIENYNNKKSEIEHLLGFVIRRKCLSKILSVQPYELQFEVGEKGKPFCKNFQNLFFNISHGGDYVVFAVSDKEVGVDIEMWKRKVNFEIANRFFSKREIEQLNQVSKEEKQKLFFQFWTAKESYLKMLGTGLTKPLSSFSIIFNHEKIDIFEEDRLLDETNIFQFYAESNHIISVCAYHKIDHNSNFKKLTIEELLNF